MPLYQRMLMAAAGNQAAPAEEIMLEIVNLGEDYGMSLVHVSPGVWEASGRLLGSGDTWLLLGAVDLSLSFSVVNAVVLSGSPVGSWVQISPNPYNNFGSGDYLATPNLNAFGNSVAGNNPFSMRYIIAPT